MDSNDNTLVIVGAGHAGSELAIAARQAGWPGPIVLLGDEAAVPYHRPPLSKAYLCGQADLDAIALRPATAYQLAQVTRMTGVTMRSIDRTAHTLTLEDGRVIGYTKLALCLGGRPRPLLCPGIDAAAPPENLLYLRTLADADRIRAEIAPGCRIVIVGGGYVGLEVAASATKLGAQVTVLEAQPRVLARVAGERLSAFYEAMHRAQGVDVLTGTGVTRVAFEGGRITAVTCSDGRTLPADLVVAGIGMLPNVQPAAAAGIGQADGIPVDENSCTADPDIVAAGDCTLFTHPLYGRQMRIESVPSALEQARAAAGWLCGKPKPYASVPWFWSDQYDLKLQMVGLSQGYDQCVIRGSLEGHSFCAFYLQGDRLLALDAVNRPGDFMAVRRALAKPVRVDAQRLADESVPLKDLLAASAAPAT